MRWPPLVVAQAYPFAKSSFAGVFPESQCHAEIGSPFLFEPPAPENVVSSRAPLWESWSATNAAATPPWRSATLPVASKMSAQSGPGIDAVPRMSAPCTGPSSNSPVWTFGLGPGDASAMARAAVSTIALKATATARAPATLRTTILTPFPNILFPHCAGAPPWKNRGGASVRDKGRKRLDHKGVLERFLPSPVREGRAMGIFPSASAKYRDGIPAPVAR